MYVNPFWFGVICTILAEIIVFIIFALRIAVNQKYSKTHENSSKTARSDKNE